MNHAHHNPSPNQHTTHQPISTTHQPISTTHQPITTQPINQSTIHHTTHQPITTQPINQSPHNQSQTQTQAQGAGSPPGGTGPRRCGRPRGTGAQAGPARRDRTSGAGPRGTPALRTAGRWGWGRTGPGRASGARAPVLHAKPAANHKTLPGGSIVVESIISLVLYECSFRTLESCCLALGSMNCGLTLVERSLMFANIKIGSLSKTIVCLLHLEVSSVLDAILS